MASKGNNGTQRRTKDREAAARLRVDPAHKPTAVARRKENGHKAFMAQLSPKVVGSAAQRRRNG